VDWFSQEIAGTFKWDMIALTPGKEAARSVSMRFILA
jgi:hypothetical protein